MINTKAYRSNLCHHFYKNSIYFYYSVIILIDCLKIYHVLRAKFRHRYSVGTLIMRLARVEIVNYRCHKNTSIPIYDITVLIGPNDSGKSSVLNALDIFFDISRGRTSKKPDIEDFYRDARGVQASTLGIICTFINDGEDEVKIKKEFELSMDKSEVVGPKWYIFTETYVEEKFQEIEREINKKRPRKEQLIDFIKNNLPNINNKKIDKMKIDELKALIREFLHQQKKTKKWIEIKRTNEVLQSIPRFELYDSNAYEDPENYLRKILSSHFNEILNEDEVKNIVSDFEQTLTNKLNERLNELSVFLKNSLANYVPGLKNIAIRPNVDPSKSFVGTIINIKDNRGEHEVIRRGQGLRKLLFVHITQWESKKEKKQLVIRAYDEPDNSLHYSAQRTFLKAVTGQENLQVIIATHSIILADMVPFHKIILFRINQDGYAETEFLDPDQIKEAEDFIAEVGVSLGISTWEFFFEKAILIVEGLTEETFISAAYRKLYNQTLKDKGIVLINIGGNAAAPFLLKILKFKAQKVYILLDNDTRTRKWRGNITFEEFLRNIGYDDNFIRNHIFYIGRKEFEDSFDDDYLVHILTSNYGISEQAVRKELMRLRGNPNLKFSKELLKWIERTSNCKVGKPEFGLKLAEHISFNSLPRVLKNLFDKIHEAIDTLYNQH